MRKIPYISSKVVIRTEIGIRTGEDEITEITAAVI